jgi:hypothetical protein
VSGSQVSQLSKDGSKIRLAVKILDDQDKVVKGHGGGECEVILQVRFHFWSIEMHARDMHHQSEYTRKTFSIVPVNSLCLRLCAVMEDQSAECGCLNPLIPKLQTLNPKAVMEDQAAECGCLNPFNPKLQTLNPNAVMEDRAAK